MSKLSVVRQRGDYRFLLPTIALRWGEVRWSGTTLAGYAISVAVGWWNRSIELFWIKEASHDNSPNNPEAA